LNLKTWEAVGGRYQQNAKEGMEIGLMRSHKNY
jgi:hypothetical protein